MIKTYYYLLINTPTPGQKVSSLHKYTMPTSLDKAMSSKVWIR